MIAIDPGAKGGFAISLPGDSATTFSMPGTLGEILRILEIAKAGGATTAYLEQLVKFAGRNMPSSAMATYASNHGKIEGMLAALHIRTIIVPPKKWQKVLGLGVANKDRTAWKNKLKQMAEQLYPHLTVTLSTADALLMLEAAKRGGLG